MTLEEAYEEALCRIQRAEETGAVKLDLSRLSELTRLPPELDRLISLQRLNLFECHQISDLAPLANLTSLGLNLSGCKQISDFSLLAKLIADLQRSHDRCFKQPDELLRKMRVHLRPQQSHVPCRRAFALFRHRAGSNRREGPSVRKKG